MNGFGKIIAGLVTTGSLASAAPALAGNVDIRVDLGFGRPQPQRVWVEPVYRTVCDRVWIDATYRTVCDRVWREPVLENRCERVFVPDEYQWQVVVVRGYDGRPCEQRQQVLVRPGYWSEVNRPVVVREGYFEEITRQEIASEGHWQEVQRQEIVRAGYWTVAGDGCYPDGTRIEVGGRVDRRDGDDHDRRERSRGGNEAAQREEARERARSDRDRAEARNDRDSRSDRDRDGQRERDQQIALREKAARETAARETRRPSRDAGRNDAPRTDDRGGRSDRDAVANNDRGSRYQR